MGAVEGTRDYGTAQDIHALYKRLRRYEEGANTEQAIAHADLYGAVAEKLYDAYDMMLNEQPGEETIRAEQHSR